MGRGSRSAGDRATSVKMRALDDLLDEPAVNDGLAPVWTQSVRVQPIRITMLDGKNLPLRPLNDFTRRKLQNLEADNRRYCLERASSLQALSQDGWDVANDRVLEELLGLSRTDCIGRVARTLCLEYQAVEYLYVNPGVDHNDPGMVGERTRAVRHERAYRRLTETAAVWDEGTPEACLECVQGQIIDDCYEAIAAHIVRQPQLAEHFLGALPDSDDPGSHSQLLAQLLQSKDTDWWHLAWLDMQQLPQAPDVSYEQLLMYMRHRLSQLQSATS